MHLNAVFGRCGACTSG